MWWWSSSSRRGLKLQNTWLRIRVPRAYIVVLLLFDVYVCIRRIQLSPCIPFQLSPLFQSSNIWTFFLLPSFFLTHTWRVVRSWQWFESDMMPRSDNREIMLKTEKLTSSLASFSLSLSTSFPVPPAWLWLFFLCVSPFSCFISHETWMIRVTHTEKD